MIRLNRDECRVLGVLVEKAFTSSGQYPLSLNAVMVGCNQKSNRLPVVSYDEDRVEGALDDLRGKQLAREVHLSGSRVIKYQHLAREALAIETPALVIVAELLLRGPQTSGELRNHATRMFTLESIDVVEAILDSLQSRGLVKKLAPQPGRGHRAMHSCSAPISTRQVHPRPQHPPGRPAQPARQPLRTRQIARLLTASADSRPKLPNCALPCNSFSTDEP